MTVGGAGVVARTGGILTGGAEATGFEASARGGVVFSRGFSTSDCPAGAGATGTVSGLVALSGGRELGGVRSHAWQSKTRTPTATAPALFPIVTCSPPPAPRIGSLHSACLTFIRMRAVPRRMCAMSKLRTHSLLVCDGERLPLILVHGAANSARVWTFWQDELAHHGWSSHALDLRGHGHGASVDVGTLRMGDYADDVVAVARTLRHPPILLGWSMGGLVAMMAAAACDARAFVGLAPSTPARVRDASVALRSGAFGAEAYW